MKMIAEYLHRARAFERLDVAVMRKIPGRFAGERTPNNDSKKDIPDCRRQADIVPSSIR